MGAETLNAGYELVHTVRDYYDGPRSGVANFGGSPYFYDCVFDEKIDDYSDVFRLTPIDTETFNLALEDWTIWKKWETAFHLGKTDLSTHPCLPNDRQRHLEIEPILEKRLVTDPALAISRVGKFEPIGNALLPKGVMRPLQVKWEEL